MYPNPHKLIPVQVNIQHKDQISPFMHEFIEKVVDVASDGHCEFRYQLQKGLIDEENERYRQLIGSDRQYK